MEHHKDSMPANLNSQGYLMLICCPQKIKFLFNLMMPSLTGLLYMAVCVIFFAIKQKNGLK